MTTNALHRQARRRHGVRRRYRAAGRGQPSDVVQSSVMVGRGRGTRALGSGYVRFLPAPEDAASAAHRPARAL
eukprot:5149236-Prymnesium_polylepis.1